MCKIFFINLWLGDVKGSHLAMAYFKTKSILHLVSYLFPGNLLVHYYNIGSTL